MDFMEIKFMKYLITGSNGQLGRALQEEFKNSSDEIILHDVDTLDITDNKQVEEILHKAKPNVVFNCAAYTNVDKCEENIDLAYKINALGVQNLAMSCKNVGAKLVHISTDYVFSGDEKAPRIESDFTAPRTVYGKSKLYGEELLKQFGERYFIVRTAWLYGDGNNFVRTMLKLSKDHNKLTVVADQFGSPTNAKDLAKVLIELSKTQYYGLYHGTCQGSCSWYEFTKKIYEIMGIKNEVIKVTSEEFKRPAPRPNYSILDNFCLRLRGLDRFRPWEEAIKDYLENDKDWRGDNL